MMIDQRVQVKELKPRRVVGLAAIKGLGSPLTFARLHHTASVATLPSAPSLQTFFAVLQQQQQRSFVQCSPIESFGPINSTILLDRSQFSSDVVAARALMQPFTVSQHLSDAPNSSLDSQAAGVTTLIRLTPSEIESFSPDSYLHTSSSLEAVAIPMEGGIYLLRHPLLPAARLLKAGASLSGSSVGNIPGNTLSPTIGESLSQSASAPATVLSPPAKSAMAMATPVALSVTSVPVASATSPPAAITAAATQHTLFPVPLAADRAVAEPPSDSPPPPLEPLLQQKQLPAAPLSQPLPLAPQAPQPNQPSGSSKPSLTSPSSPQQSPVDPAKATQPMTTSPPPKKAAPPARAEAAKVVAAPKAAPQKVPIPRLPTIDKRPQPAKSGPAGSRQVKPPPGQPQAKLTPLPPAVQAASNFAQSLRSGLRSAQGTAPQRLVEGIRALGGSLQPPTVVATAPSSNSTPRQATPAAAAATPRQLAKAVMPKADLPVPRSLMGRLGDADGSSSRGAAPGKSAAAPVAARKPPPPPPPPGFTRAGSSPVSADDDEEATEQPSSSGGDGAMRTVFMVLDVLATGYSRLGATLITFDYPAAVTHILTLMWQAAAGACYNIATADYEAAGQRGGAAVSAQLRRLVAAADSLQQSAAVLSVDDVAQSVRGGASNAAQWAASGARFWATEILDLEREVEKTVEDFNAGTAYESAEQWLQEELDPEQNKGLAGWEDLLTNTFVTKPHDEILEPLTGLIARAADSAKDAAAGAMTAVSAVLQGDVEELSDPVSSSESTSSNAAETESAGAKPMPAAPHARTESSH